MPALGIFMVAVQLYWPPSDVLSGEKVYCTDVVSMSATKVELGETIFMSGFDIRPATTVAEQFIVYCWPAMESPENEMLTFGGGRAEQVRERNNNNHMDIIIPVTIRFLL